MKENQKSQKTLSRLTRVLLKRSKMGFLEIARDKGTLCALFSVIFTMGCWVSVKYNTKQEQQSSSQSMLVLGLYFGSILSSGNRIALISYFNEKSKKMMSFLLRAGTPKSQ